MSAPSNRSSWVLPPAALNPRAPFLRVADGPCLKKKKKKEKDEHSDCLEAITKLSSFHKGQTADPTLKGHVAHGSPQECVILLQAILVLPKAQIFNVSDT